MSNPQREFKLPEELADALDHYRLSVSPTGQAAPANWFSFAFDGLQEDELNAFGSSPAEAVANVIAKLNSPHVSPATSSDTPLYPAPSQQVQDALCRQPREIAVGEARDKDISNAASKPKDQR
ncbi:hypothetical protein [Pseudomonas sp. NPDC096950]|uniref:hypothetical protein n=1 Tax=Pseudomonas sp. NPDC096950 TaxID=3364485 RepID=UPI00383BC294